MNETHEVLKPFEGAGRHVFKKGEKVDARDWPHVARLVSQRYLRPLYTEKAEMTPDDRYAVLENRIAQLEQAVESQGKMLARISRPQGKGGA